MDRYAQQELLRRLQYLKTRLEELNIPSKTIEDAIEFISKEK
jgi:hypothetical protein